MEYLDDGRRLPKPKVCSAELFMKILECWLESGHDRPCFFHLSIFMREYMVKTKGMENEQPVVNNGFDSDWLHCYAELNQGTTRLLSHGSVNTNYETTNLTELLCQSRELNKSDLFLDESCGELISLEKKRTNQYS